MPNTKLTLEFPDGFKHSIVAEGLEPTLDDIQGMYTLINECHKQWLKEQAEDHNGT